MSVWDNHRDWLDATGHDPEGFGHLDLRDIPQYQVLRADRRLERRATVLAGTCGNRHGCALVKVLRVDGALLAVYSTLEPGSRLVADDGHLVPHASHRLAWRGAWLTADWAREAVCAHRTATITTQWLKRHVDARTRRAVVPLLAWRVRGDALVLDEPDPSDGVVDERGPIPPRLA